MAAVLQPPNRRIRARNRVLLGIGLLCVCLPAFAGSYEQVILVSDISGIARFPDANLVNSWGITYGPTTPFWIADNNAGVATLYNQDGVASSLVVQIPLPGGTCPTPTPQNPTPTLAAPTGIVFNGSATSFPVAPGKPAPFIFDTEDGTISAWNPQVNLHCAVLVVDNSTNTVDRTLNGKNTGLTLGAVYKGLAIGNNGSGDFIYATNFRDGVVEIYDAQFHFVGFFTDPNITPDAASPGFAPFGIQSINGWLYVTFAMQNSARHDDVAGAGSGFVDVFDLNGNLKHTFASGGRLNSPWGLALAPDGFGRFSDHLLIGNFGDGHINAFDFHSRHSDGPLKNERGEAIFIGGLWGLKFGGGGKSPTTGALVNGLPNELFFTAGIGDEGHGLFGKIIVDPDRRDDDHGDHDHGDH
jgi:uncharacterized protein (TIGR03118 family)